jgi:signal transduction histidine kinase
MSSLQANRRRGQSAWRTAGLPLVLIAVVLAVTGAVLMFLQARLIRVQLDNRVLDQARHIAVTSSDLFRQELTAALRIVAYAKPNEPVDALRLSGALPGWIDGLWQWDGTALELLDQPATHTGDLEAAVRTLLDRPQPVELPSALTPLRPTLRDVPMPDGGSVLLAMLEARDTYGDPMVYVVGVTRTQVIEELIAPLVALADGLELVPTSEAVNALPPGLDSALGDWSLQLTEDFVHDQRSRFFAQAFGYMTLTLLALVTMLVAMWLLLGVMRREVALAEMKSNFVADVSHELKTPLALIQMFGETLHSGRVPTEEKRREYYGIIIRESTRLTNLINNILDFARIDAGQKEYRFEPTDIEELVRDTYEAYQMELDHAGFTHVLRVEPNLPMISVDRDAIIQVLINLISNAIKYSDDEKALEIDVSQDTLRDRHGVLIEVKDEGIGIRPEDRAHLFDGFYRSSDGRVRKVRGTGLGLALSKHIIDAHDGSVNVVSRLVKGTAFRVFLPVLDRPGEAGEVNTAP